jgi:hypothetical protein
MIVVEAITSQNNESATRSDANDAPVAGSQIRTSPSSPAETSQHPSEMTAKPRTPRLWPFRVWRMVPVVMSQIRTFPSSPAEASQDPSGATSNTLTSPEWPVKV